MKEPTMTMMTKIPPAQKGRPPRPLCCPDTDSLWFPRGIEEALIYLWDKGYANAKAHVIRKAIESGREAYGHTWDFADAAARKRHLPAA